MEDIPASNNVLSARYTDEEQQDEAVAEFEFIDDPENPENEHPRAKLSLTVFSYLSEWSDVWRIEWGGSFDGFLCQFAHLARRLLSRPQCRLASLSTATTSKRRLHFRAIEATKYQNSPRGHRL